MLEIKEFDNSVEHYTKLGSTLERFKTTMYLKRIKKEIDFCLDEKKAIESRLKFLNKEYEKALHYNLLH